MSYIFDDSSSVSREQVIAAYLNALHLIDDRVAPLLGKATTRVLVQVAAKRAMIPYPFLHVFVKMPYSEMVPSVMQEQFAGVTAQELADGLNALLDECFAGLRELTGSLIAPPLHDEVTNQLKQIQ